MPVRSEEQPLGLSSIKVSGFCFTQSETSHTSNNFATQHHLHFDICWGGGKGAHPGRIVALRSQGNMRTAWVTAACRNESSRFRPSPHVKESQDMASKASIAGRERSTTCMTWWPDLGPWQSWPEVTGDTSGHDALDAEDEVLRILYVLRRQMAEGVLHQTKARELL